MKHTPGPWVAARMLLSPSAKDRRCGWVVNGPDADADSLPVRICDLRAPYGVGGFAEGEANAHLIAAAPTMLEALRDIHKLWCCPAPKRMKDWSARCDVMADYARKALAQAEDQP
jgi:hypothetical protein